MEGTTHIPWLLALSGRHSHKRPTDAGKAACSRESMGQVPTPPGRGVSLSCLEEDQVVPQKGSESSTVPLASLNIRRSPAPCHGGLQEQS